MGLSSSSNRKKRTEPGKDRFRGKNRPCFELGLVSFHLGPLRKPGKEHPQQLCWAVYGDCKPFVVSFSHYTTVWCKVLLYGIKTTRTQSYKEIFSVDLLYPWIWALSLADKSPVIIFGQSEAENSSVALIYAQNIFIGSGPGSVISLIVSCALLKTGQLSQLDAVNSRW